MRYTRYNYNRRRGGRNNKGSGFLASFTVIVVLAIVLGILVGKMVLKEGVLPVNPPNDQTIDTSGNNDTETTETVSPVGDKKDFYFLQCGVFSTKENSDALLQTLPSGQSGFTIQDGDKFKALVGVFTADNVEAGVKALNDAGISNMKVKFQVEVKNDSDKIKIEILDGYIKILNKLNEKDVKGYNTNQFKEWISSNEDKIKGDEEVKALVEGIKSLPDELNKGASLDITKKIYELIKKYKV